MNSCSLFCVFDSLKGSFATTRDDCLTDHQIDMFRLTLISELLSIRDIQAREAVRISIGIFMLKHVQKIRGGNVSAGSESTCYMSTARKHITQLNPTLENTHIGGFCKTLADELDLLNGSAAQRKIRRLVENRLDKLIAESSPAGMRTEPVSKKVLAWLQKCDSTN